MRGAPAARRWPQALCVPCRAWGTLDGQLHGRTVATSTWLCLPPQATPAWRGAEGGALLSPPMRISAGRRGHGRLNLCPDHTSGSGAGIPYGLLGCTWGPAVASPVPGPLHPWGVLGGAPAPRCYGDHRISLPLCFASKNKPQSPGLASTRPTATAVPGQVAPGAPGRGAQGHGPWPA